MAKRQQRLWRREEYERRESRQREAVLAEFDAGNTDATLHASVTLFTARLSDMCHFVVIGSGQPWMTTVVRIGGLEWITILQRHRLK